MDLVCFHVLHEKSGVSQRRGGVLVCLSWRFRASVLITLSLCLHELGHALVGAILGMKVTGFGMGFWGAYTSFAQQPSAITPQSEIAVAFAGPAVNLAIFVIAGIKCVAKNAEYNPIAGCVAVTNLSLALSNLLPVYLFSIGGLDGGFVADGFIRLNVSDQAHANMYRVLLDAASMLFVIAYAHQRLRARQDERW